MLVTINKSHPSGTVSPPPSKSYTHRALILGAFSEKSEIENVSFSEDIKATLSCLSSLGARIETARNSVTLGGIDLSAVADGASLSCRESGSTLRFLIPVCLLTGKRLTLYGTEKLLSRPLSEYQTLCAEKGFIFKKSTDSVTVCGNLSAGRYRLRSDASSQFVSGMILALSLCPGESEITLEGEITSRPYIEMTLKTVRDFGIIAEINGNRITVSGKTGPAPTRYTVESDASNAAYLEAFGLIGEVGVAGMPGNTLQGDIVYRDYFSRLTKGEKHFDLKDCPDLAPVMFSACCLFGGSEFSGTRRLKFKESDRVAAMGAELQKFGVKLDIKEDSVAIDASGLRAPDSLLSGHNDHRIVMALSLLCAKFGGAIEGAQAVSKSFPDFFERLSEIKVGVIKNA